MIFKVGLTGGIGSGKTTVSDMFQELGVPVFDADVVAHQITRNDHPVLARVRQHFGADAIDKEGNMDRTYIRNLVFNDEAKKRQLEEILHPAIRAQMDEAIADCKASYCILSIPLLLETQQRDRVDRLLVVDAPDERRMEWIRQRSGLSDNEILAIMANQVSRNERLCAADDVIENNGSREDLKPVVLKLHEKYLALAGKE